MLQSDLYLWLKKNPGWQTIKRMAKKMNNARTNRISQKLLQLEKYGFIEKRTIEHRTNMYRVKE